MNYRHAFHAGNFADVVKHLALVGILLHLRQKEAPFAVIDTHAGRGVYDLRSEAAQRTGEAQTGIKRILSAFERADSLPPFLDHYLSIVRRTGDDMYPGSPVLAASLLRPHDRLVAIEEQDDEAAVLSATLASFQNRTLKSEHADGYARLSAVLPPAERRGVVLLDPPFEAPDEFYALARTTTLALRRFATGIYLIWFPIKSLGDASALSGEIVAAGAKKALHIGIAVAASGAASSRRLVNAGLIVINPPFGFAKEMGICLARVAPCLSARTELRWLVGEDD